MGVLWSRIVFILHNDRAWIDRASTFAVAPSVACDKKRRCAASLQVQAVALLFRDLAGVMAFNTKRGVEFRVGGHPTIFIPQNFPTALAVARENVQHDGKIRLFAFHLRLFCIIEVERKSGVAQELVKSSSKMHAVLS